MVHHRCAVVPLPALEFSRAEQKSTSEYRVAEHSILQALCSVVTNGLDRAAFPGFFTAGFLFVVFRLFVNKGIAAVVVAFEVVWSSFPAEITVDTLVVDVILARSIFRVPVCDVSHIAETIWAAGRGGRKSFQAPGLLLSIW